MATSSVHCTESTDWTNFVEVRACGLMRSGNHAILQWVQNQHAGHPTCFLNNVLHGDHDPYVNYSQIILAGIDGETEVETLRSMKKRLLIYSYEDRAELSEAGTDLVESVFHSSFDSNRQHYLGTSANRVDLMIIRDPFNCIASRLKLMQDSGTWGGVSDLDFIIQNWKALAKEVLSLSSSSSPGRVVANFNRWVTDPSYRRELSQVVLGIFNDSSVHRLSGFAGGSSFDGQGRLTWDVVTANWRKLLQLKTYLRIGYYWSRMMATPVKRMKITERWKHFVDDEQFRKAMCDSELIDLSENIFGEIAGTRDFVNRLLRNRELRRIRSS